MTENSMIQTFGEYTDKVSSSPEYLTLNFSPGSAPRQRRWKNYGLSADFLGDYFASFFPGDDVSDDQEISQRDTVKGTVSYIANELLENAVKYSDEAASLPISISLHLYSQEIVFHATNYANRSMVDRYQAFIQELITSDIDELYTQQLEKTAMGTGNSHMGLLTMINDYSARFGWKFQTLEKSQVPEKSQDIIQVNVLVHLDV